MTIISLDKYKLLAGIATDKYDEKISAYIPLIEEDYLSIRNHPFDKTLKQMTNEQGEPVFDENTGEPVMEEITIYPKGSELTAFEMLQWKMSPQGKNGVVSESIGSYSYTLGSSLSSSGYPSEITAKIKRWSRTNVNRKF